MLERNIFRRPQTTLYGLSNRLGMNNRLRSNQIFFLPFELLNQLVRFRVFFKSKLVGSRWQWHDNDLETPRLADQNVFKFSSNSMEKLSYVSRLPRIILINFDTWTGFSSFLQPDQKLFNNWKSSEYFSSTFPRLLSAFHSFPSFSSLSFRVLLSGWELLKINKLPSSCCWQLFSLIIPYQQTDYWWLKILWSEKWR